MIEVINAGKLEGDHGETVGVWLGLKVIPGYKVEQINIGFDVLSDVVKFYKGRINPDDVVIEIKKECQ